MLEASVTRINVETNQQCSYDWVEMSDPTVTVEPVKVCGTCRQGSFQSGSDELYILYVYTSADAPYIQFAAGIEFLAKAKVATVSFHQADVENFPLPTIIIKSIMANE